jgi:hypothetical protein
LITNTTTKTKLTLLLVTAIVATALTTAATTNEVLAMSHVQLIAPNDKATATAVALSSSSSSVNTNSQKCNNVMILVKVKDIPDNLITLVITANLDGKNIVKAINIKDQNIIDMASAEKGSLTVPLSFKKLDGCKSGDQFAGSVNDVAFVGKLDSPRKPTKVSVSLLSGAGQ